MNKELRKKGKVIVILGPTASGKSDVAIELAKKFNGEIISADSRQVYRGMDIGTGKVTGSIKPVILSEDARSATESKDLVFISDGIPHHLIDIVSPNTEYNVTKFKRDAEKTIGDILKRGKIPIICGGTGFWIDAIVNERKFPEVKPNKKLRIKMQDLSADELFGKLHDLDPERAGTIDPKNKVRLIRAIEICHALGCVPKHKIQDTRYEFFQIGIDISKEQLHKNIEKRLDARLKQGMVAETKRLHEKHHVSWKKIEAFGLEYRWTARFLRGKISESGMRENLLRDIKRYAKRQMTWFRRDKQIRWISDQGEIEMAVRQFIEK